MIPHAPRLVAGAHAYCATCGRALRRLGGAWQAVWSRSPRCTGAPTTIGGNR